MGLEHSPRKASALDHAHGVIGLALMQHIWSSSQTKWLGPSSELMALSLALAPTCWLWLALLAAVAILPLLACMQSPASIAEKKEKKVLSIVCGPVHSSTACHDRPVAAYSCPSTTALTSCNRTEQPSFLRARSC